MEEDDEDEDEGEEDIARAITDCSSCREGSVVALCTIIPFYFILFNLIQI